MTPIRLAIILLVVALAGGAWYLASPLLLDTAVDEAFPSARTGLTAEEQAALDEMESLTPEDVAAMPEAERAEKKRMMDTLGEKMEDERAEEPMPAEPAVLARGMFRDADSFHRGSGDATAYRLPDGSRVLRFEDFSVTNGPALSVYLTKSADGDVSEGFLDLGKLKGNVGNQNYDIPADVNLEDYRGVIIWCVPFGVTFATATLE